MLYQMCMHFGDTYQNTIKNIDIMSNFNKKNKWNYISNKKQKIDFIKIVILLPIVSI